MAALHRLDSWTGRLLAHLDAHLRDHQFVRAVYANLHPVGGGMWRSSQPSPAQLRAWQHRLGLKTVINLRGAHRYGSYALEAEACERLGLRLIDFKVYSRDYPAVDEVLPLRRIFETIEYPALMHCKSGADRTGLAATLYRHWRFGDAIGDIRQLHWRYGHFRAGDTARLDMFFEAYIQANAAAPVSLEDWVRGQYDQQAMNRAFERDRKPSLGRWFIDRVLRRE